MPSPSLTPPPPPPPPSFRAENVALFENQTSEADVEGDIPDEIWTGDDDLSKAGYIYKVNDSTTYNDYGPTLEVSGSTGASFGPNPDTSASFFIFIIFWLCSRELFT